MEDKEKEAEDIALRLLNSIRKLEDLLNSIPETAWGDSSEILEIATEVQQIFHNFGQGAHIAVAMQKDRIKLKFVMFPLNKKEEQTDLNIDEDFLKFLKDNKIKLPDN